MAHSISAISMPLWRQPFERPPETVTNRGSTPRGMVVGNGSVVIPAQGAPDTRGLTVNITPGDEFAYRITEFSISITSTTTVNEYSRAGQMVVLNPSHVIPATLGPMSFFHEIFARANGFNSAGLAVVTFELEDSINEIFLAPEGLSLSFQASLANMSANAQPQMTAVASCMLLYYDIEQYFRSPANVQTPVLT